MRWDGAYDSRLVGGHELARVDWQRLVRIHGDEQAVDLRIDFVDRKALPNAREDGGVIELW